MPGRVTSRKKCQLKNTCYNIHTENNFQKLHELKKNLITNFLIYINHKMNNNLQTIQSVEDKTTLITTGLSLNKYTFKQYYPVKKVRHLINLGDALIDQFWEAQTEDQNGEKYDLKAYTSSLMNHLKKDLSPLISKNLHAEYIEVEAKYLQRQKGRMYSTRGTFTQQDLQCNLRKFLSGDLTIDLDISKCHWNIALQCAAKINEDLPMIKLYLSNPKKFMDKHNVNKIDLIKLMYIDNYTSKNGFLMALHNEKQDLFNKLIETEDFRKYNFEPTVNSTKKGNQLSSVVSQYFQTKEHEILEIVIKEHPLAISIPMFDGANFFIKYVEDYGGLDAFLKHLNELTGYTWEQKENVFHTEMEEDIDDYFSWKDEFEKDHFILAHPFEYVKHSEYGLLGYTKAHFKDLYENDLANLNMWFKDKSRRQFDRLTMVPYAKGKEDPTRDNEYNTWKEYAANRVPDLCGCKPTDFMDLLENSLCWDEDEAERERQADWFMNYLAFHIQYPEIKSQVGVVFESPPGCGKDLVMAIIQKMLGAHTTIITENANDLFVGLRSGDNFNKDVAGKKLLILNEGVAGEIVELMDKIKAHITSSEVHINRKNKDTYSIPDYSSFISLTNNKFPIENHDRRFVKFQGKNWTIASQDEKDKFFKPKWAILESQEALDLLFTTLSERELGSWTPRGNRIITKAYTKSKMMNHKNTSCFLKHLLTNDWDELRHLPASATGTAASVYGDRWIGNKDFRPLYLDWLKNFKNKEATAHTKMNVVYDELESLGVTKQRLRVNGNSNPTNITVFDTKLIEANLIAIGIIEKT